MDEDDVGAMPRSPIAETTSAGADRGWCRCGLRVAIEGHVSIQEQASPAGDYLVR